MKSLLWVANGDDEIVEHADWVEISTLFRADHSVSREDLTRAINQAQKIRDTEARKIAEDAFKELDDRISSCGVNHLSGKSFYPYSLNSDKTVLSLDLASASHERSLYLFLLTVTRGDMSSRARRFADLDPTALFEKLCASVLLNFWGGKAHFADGIVFGTARGKNANQTEKKFPANVTALCHQLGEGFGWKKTARSPKAGDGGLDLVVWRKFADKRKGALVGFGQCKTGFHWRSHLGKLKPRAFSGKYFTDQLIIEPQELYLVPCRITASRWDDDTRDGGLLLDRCRIVQYSSTIDGEIVKSCKKWMDACHERQKALVQK